MQGYSPPLSSFNCAPDLALPVSYDVYIRFSSVNNKLELIQSACDGKFKAVSDTSYTPTMNVTTAAAAWVMETDDRRFSWEGSSLFFSPQNSSYGGEIYGIYLILRFLDIIWPRKTNLVRTIKDKMRQLNRDK